MAKKEKGVAVRPISQHNPWKSRFGSRNLQLRIYGLVSALIVTVALIGILEYVNRSLPNGSKTQYSPPLRIRDALEPEKAPVLAVRDSNSSLASTTTPSSTAFSTQFFLPATMTSTITEPQCPALPATCECPQDSEIPQCTCLPDPSASFCTCTVKENPSYGPNTTMVYNTTNPYIRECVCPPDSACRGCICAGAGSYYESCACPSDPYAAGCTLNPRAAVCSEYSYSECGCSVFEEFYCGYIGTSSQCSDPTSTLQGVDSSVITIYPTVTGPATSSSYTALTSPPTNNTFLTLVTSVARTSINSSTSSLGVSNTTVASAESVPVTSVKPTTVVPVPVTSLPATSEPVTSVKATSLVASSVPVPVTSVPASSAPATLVSTVVSVPTASAISSAAEAPTVAAESTATLNLPVSTVVQPTSEGPSPAGAPTEVPVSSTISSPPPISTGVLVPSAASSPLAISTGIILGLSGTAPKTSTISVPESSALGSGGVILGTSARPTPSTSPLGPGGIVLVSSSLVPVTSGPASYSVIAVTFFQTTLAPSASLITGPSGTVYTVPSILLLPTLVLTPAVPVTSLISSRPVTSPAPTISLAPATLARSSSLSASDPGVSSILTSSNPAISGTEASALPASSPIASGTGSSPLTSPLSAEISLLPSPIASTLSSREPSLSTNPLVSASLIGSSQLGSAGQSLMTDNSAGASGTASAAQHTSNSKATPISEQNGATSVLSSGAGGGTSTSTPTPIPSTLPVRVTIYSWPVSRTVLGGYIPVILARLVHLAWTAIYDHLNKHELLHQFNAQYGADSSILFGTGSALWYVWPAYAAAWLLAPFASELVYFDTNYGCANPNVNNPTNPCWPPVMSVNGWIVRVLQTFLVLVALTLVALIIIALWFRKPSGSAGDPTSIAAVAAILGHPEIEEEFKAFDGNMTTQELKQRLKGKKYRLGDYLTATNTPRYGMIPVHSENEAEVPASANSGSDIPSPTAISRMKMSFTSPKNWKRFQMKFDIVFVGYLWGMLSAVIVYISHINNMTVIHLFDGSTVGRRLLFAILGCLAASYWARLQRDAQTLAPYTALAYPNEAPPQPTILFRKRSLSIVAIFTLLRNRYIIGGLTALTAVLSEFLIVTLSGLPYRPGQLRGEFLFCGISSLVVLSIMLVMLLVVNLWREGRVPDLPRKPNNIAAVMTYTIDSRMNADFEGLERVKIEERDIAINRLGKRYRYGERRCTDGKDRWVVDEVGAGCGDIGRAETAS